MLALALAFAACSSPDRGSRGDSETTAFNEATCAGFWPADSCGEDGCDADPVGSRWEDTFVQAFSEASGQPRDVVAQHVRIRDMVPAPSLTAITRADYQVDVGWVRIVEHADVSGPGPAGTADVTGTGAITDDELVEAWKEHLPNVVPIDLEQELVALADAQAFVDQCAEDEGVIFGDEGWCSASLSAFRLAFYADLTAPDFVDATLWLDGSEPFSCEKQSYSD